MPIVAARGSREMRKERSGEKDIEIGGERERERDREREREKCKSKARPRHVLSCRGGSVGEPGLLNMYLCMYVHMFVWDLGPS